MLITLLICPHSQRRPIETVLLAFPTRRYSQRAQQRRLLWRLNADPAQRRNRRTLEGLIALLDAIADQAHDVHSIDCLEPGT